MKKFETRIDRFTSDEWDQFCLELPEMSIYQIGLYGQLHSKSMFRSCSRIAVSRDKKIMAVAQVRIKSVPFLPIGVAEIDWGPLWNDCQNNIKDEGLAILLDELKKEYCEKRKLQLRIRPRSTMSLDIDAQIHEIFINHGFHKNLNVRPYHTIVIDLEKSFDTIRAELHQKWRNQLNVAERAGLEHECGNSIEHFDRFYNIYRAMWRHKKFPTGVRLPIIRELQAQLPTNKKMLITIIRDGQTDIGATVCAIFGNTMLYFLGAYHHRI